MINLRGYDALHICFRRANKMKQSIFKEGLDVVLNFLQKIEESTRREKHVTNLITLHYVKDAEELSQLRTECGSKPYS